MKRARSTATTIVSRVIISGKCLVASMIGYAAILLEILFLPLPESLGLTDLSSCAVREKSTEGRGENIATDVLSNSWCIIFIIFTPYILLHCVSCYHRQLRSMLRLNICSQEFQPPGQRRPSVWLVPESNQKNQKKIIISVKEWPAGWGSRGLRRCSSGVSAYLPVRSTCYISWSIRNTCTTTCCRISSNNQMHIKTS